MAYQIRPKLQVSLWGMTFTGGDTSVATAAQFTTVVSIAMEGCVIRDNAAGGDGGGVMVEFSRPLNFEFVVENTGLRLRGLDDNRCVGFGIGSGGGLAAFTLSRSPIHTFFG